MTVEDILSKYPEEFFQEEERCDYLVSSQIKKIWCLQIDLLEQVKKVCKKYDIKYFASSGTLIGAFRHKGYIPWDDDIDLDMMRDDYEKFCKIAPKEFKYPYFFQTEKTDPGSLRGHIQIRNSLTTAILNSELADKFNFNQGVFIDIFPLDAVSENEEERTKFTTEMQEYIDKYRRFASITSRPIYFKNNKTKQFGKKVFAKFITTFKIYNPYFKQFDEYCQKYNNTSSKLVERVTLHKVVCKHIHKKEDFLETIEVPFEFTTISVPKNYDSVLIDDFGPNWKIPLKASSCHGDVLFDLEKPYTDYIKK